MVTEGCTRRARVLLLDDGSDHADVVVAALAEASSALEVVTVRGRDALLAELAAGDVELIVTAPRLLWSDEVSVLETVKSSLPEVPMIVWGAPVADGDTIDGMRTNLDEYVVKSPAQVAWLRFAIRRALERRGSREEAERLREQQRELMERERASVLEADGAHRVRDEFLATLSHEFRTPLSALVGWTRLLREGGVDQETMERAIDSMDRSCNMLVDLIEDLLDMSDITMGRVRLRVATTDLVGILDDVVEAFRPAAEARNIQIQSRLDRGAGRVSADPGRLRQVVWNLVANAVKFTPAGGRVTLRLERDGSSVKVVVADTGRGISPEFLPFVFDRFRQAEPSRRRTNGGVGVGLSIAKHLVELHGGTLEAASEGTGKGATLTVRIPAGSADESRAD
jgi:signal transduction histidine kinase